MKACKLKKSFRWEFYITQGECILSNKWKVKFIRNVLFLHSAITSPFFKPQEAVKHFSFMLSHSQYAAECMHLYVCLQQDCSTHFVFTWTCAGCAPGRLKCKTQSSWWQKLKLNQNYSFILKTKSFLTLEGPQCLNQNIYIYNLGKQIIPQILEHIAD